MSILNEPWRKDWKEKLQSQKLRQENRLTGHGDTMAVLETLQLLAESRYSNVTEAALSQRRGELDVRGYLRICDVPMTVEDIADSVCLPAGVVRRSINKLIEFGWVGNENGMFYLTNYLTRQVSNSALRVAYLRYIRAGGTPTPIVTKRVTVTPRVTYIPDADAEADHSNKGLPPNPLDDVVEPKAPDPEDTGTHVQQVYAAYLEAIPGVNLSPVPPENTASNIRARLYDAKRAAPTAPVAWLVDAIRGAAKDSWYMGEGAMANRPDYLFRSSEIVAKYRSKANAKAGASRGPSAHKFTTPTAPATPGRLPPTKEWQPPEQLEGESLKDWYARGQALKREWEQAQPDPREPKPAEAS